MIVAVPLKLWIMHILSVPLSVCVLVLDDLLYIYVGVLLTVWPSETATPDSWLCEQSGPAAG